jgi:exo-beta-1,3-glucanase (GH17 family)
MHRSVAPLLLFLSACVVLAWWWPNRLQDPDPGVRVAKFNSLSYEGYRTGQSPLTDRFPTAAEVDQDLAFLAPITRAIRTYAALEGPYEIPALARKHGLRVWQGIWLGTDRAKNALEMAHAIEMAHRYPDTIERLIVGNEVLLRRDLPVDELIADIDHVRAAVKQPVAYADVSDFWDQFPQVAPHVDIVLIHLLPYWEDVPTSIDHAVAAGGALYEHFVARFPGKQVAIGETGWPSCCRQRRDAVPSRINQARFLRGFMELAAEKHFDYNFFEAFDEDWKYQNEGLVGANWGLFTAGRTQKIPPSGPLREDPRWWLHAVVSVGCGLLLSAIGLAARTPEASWATSPQLVLLGMTLGAALGAAQADAAPMIFDLSVRLAAVVNLGGQAVLAMLAMLRMAGAVAAAPFRTGADATRRVRMMLRGRRPGWPGLFEDLCFLFVWTAGVQQILLVFDPRYREFPLFSFAVPAVVTAARVAQGDLPQGGAGREEVLLALALTGGAVASAVQEGALNGQSLVWNACAVLLTVPLWGTVFEGTSSFLRKRRTRVS